LKITQEHLDELRSVCVKPEALSEGSYNYVYLPELVISRQGNELVKRDALLCPQERDGYKTRLFLSAPVPGKGQNWSRHQILGRIWHTCSWNNISPGRPAEILAEHLVVFR